MLVTLALGAVFLAGTAVEWHRLMYVEGLTIQTNLFGTTYFSLVGLHAIHVTAGVVGARSLGAIRTSVVTNAEERYARSL